MRLQSRIRVSAVAWLLLSVFLSGTVQAQSIPLAIRGTTVVDVTDGSLASRQTVLIHAGRIIDVGPDEEVAIPEMAEVVDAADTYLIPGLWDMHAHALGSTQAFAPFFKALLANGVTGIRDPQPSSRELAAMIEPALRAGAMRGPSRLVVAGNMVDGPNPAWPGSQVADTPQRARAIVDSLVDVGAPFIKVYSKLWPEAYLSLADRARQRGIPFVGHVPSSVSAAMASDAGQRSIEHFTGVMLGCTSAEEAALAASMPGKQHQPKVILPLPQTKPSAAGGCRPFRSPSTKSGAAICSRI